MNTDWGKIKGVVDEAMRERLLPGCVVGVVEKERNGFCTKIVPFGRFTYEKNAPAVSEKSIYDVASLTKVLPVSTLALMLLEKGSISLDDRIGTFLPKLKGPYRDAVTVEHLLTQTLEFSYTFSSLQNLSPKEIFEKIYLLELARPPGTACVFSNATSVLLGLVIEQVSGRPLDVLARHLLFDPLGLTRTTFFPERFPIEEVVPTEESGEGGGSALQGVGEGARSVSLRVVHDETTRRLKTEANMIVGSAGLFSTGEDMLKFVGAVLGNEIERLGPCTGSGWQVDNGRLFKTGFTGCLMMLDLNREKGLVVLSNAVHPKRHENYIKNRNGFFRKISDVVFD